MALYQTSVQVSTGTAAALAALAADRGHSRDATMRELLPAHVERQEARGPDARLSHLSTLLRFPLRPFGRSAALPGRRLPLRLPTSLVAKAQATALRLPGQPPRRGPRDYQARPLTDAVTTAIAEAHPIADPELDGLLPLLRHRSAESLWRLAVAGTLTRAEQAAYAGTDLPAEVAELVAEELRYHQTAWHGPIRLAVLWRMADRFLVGQDAERHERMLFDQLPDPGPATVMGSPWTFGRWLYEAHTGLAGVINGVDELALDHNIDTARVAPDPDGDDGEDDGENGDGPLEDDPPRDFGHLVDGPADDSDDGPRASQSNEGRGGATVWRARRRVALDDLARWLVEIHRAVSDPVALDQRRRSTIGATGPVRARRLVTPPGWTVALPARWTGLVVLAGRESPEQRTWLRERRILGIDVGRRRLLWPLVPVPDGRSCALEPVPGMEVVLRRLGGWSPGEVAELVLASIPDRGFLDPDDSPKDVDAEDDGDGDDRESGPRRQVATPAYVAHRHGLIDETTLRALVADAAHRTQTDMAATVRALAPQVRAQISIALPARSSTAEFNRLLAEWGHHGIVETRPTWPWPVASIADALEQGVLLGAVAWLVDHDLYRCRSTLERSMRDAWATALIDYRVSRRPSP